MRLDDYQPTFLIEIEGKRLSKDITHEITSFVFEDNEAEMDVMEISVTDRYLQFVDDPLFQEGNEIVARFGYVDDLSPRKVAVIKEIDYDFPESGEPTIKIKAYDKAYDKGHKLAGKPAMALEYFTDREGVLRSFTPSTQSQGVKGSGTAAAVTIGIPTLVAKQNIEVRGVGRKFSGTYYCTSVRHIFQDGYSCELKLKRNALGKGAGAKAVEVKGKKNEHEAPRQPKKRAAIRTGHAAQVKRSQPAKPVKPKPKMVRIDANTGRVISK